MSSIRHAFCVSGGVTMSVLALSAVGGGSTLMQFTSGEAAFSTQGGHARCERIQSAIVSGYRVTATEPGTGRVERVQRAWCIPAAFIQVMPHIARAFTRAYQL